MLKHILLLLFAFICTQNTQCCSGPGPGGIVVLAGIITAVECGTLFGLNAPLADGVKFFGLKRNLSLKNIATSSLLGSCISMAAAIGGATHYNKEKSRYNINLGQAANNIAPSFVITATLTTAYNIYQCTKEEPKKEIPALPNNPNIHIAQQIYQKSTNNRKSNDA